MSVITITSKPTFFQSIINNSWVKSIRSEWNGVDPNKLKERNLLLQIEAAKSHGRLSEGITEAWIAAINKKGKLFIAEKDVLFPENGKKKLFHQMAFVENTSISPQQVVDDTVSKVLEEGGDVEFVENGLLKNYRHLVMIQFD